MNIHFIAPVLPPKLDGIGDYTANLAQEIAKTNSLTILTGQGQTPTPIPGVTITPAFSDTQPKSVWNLLQHFKKDQPDWAILQYNPFAYGKWGLNLHLPRIMRRIKRLTPRTRVAVMVHEQYVPFTTWQFKAMSLWQRWQFAQLVRDSDVMFFSVGLWADQVRPKRRGKPTIHLPVGSNIPLVPIERSDARARLGIAEETVVLGFFGTAHVSRMLGWVADAARAVWAARRDVVVLYIGPDVAAIKAALGGIPMIADGALPAEEISRRFAAMDIYLSPFIDGVSTRRTSMMTAMQHGIATVGTNGYNTDQMLMPGDKKHVCLCQARKCKEFIKMVTFLAANSADRKLMGENGQVFYNRYFKWEILSDKTLAALIRFKIDQESNMTMGISR